MGKWVFTGSKQTLTEQVCWFLHLTSTSVNKSFLIHSSTPLHDKNGSELPSALILIGFALTDMANCCEDIANFISCMKF